MDNTYSEMTDYQDWVWESTSAPMKDCTRELAAAWAGHGLVSETAEVSTALEKGLRKNGIITEVTEDRVFDELGDCLFWIAAMLNAIDRDMSDLVHHNIDKINRRVAEGTHIER